MKTKDLGNKEIMSENIKRHLSKKSLNVKEFSEIMGFKYTTVLDWVNAKTYPRIDKIELMSRYFGVDKSDLVEKHSETSSILSEINKISSQLEEPRQKVVLNTATNQLNEQIEKKRLSFFSNKVDFDKISNIVPYDPNKEGYAPVIGEIAAGTPILSEQNFEGMRPVYGKYAGRDDIFWLRVKGESMETEIHDGSFALILQDPDLSEGSIGAIRFTDDNEATLKCVFYEYDENGYPLRLRLEPLNPDYPIQYADEYNPAEIEGRLVKVEQDY
ncbi:LexA family protein [Lactococcus lactis]|uniref:LexA family protein n=1 Tax=Lactococcus lactis TaxID=1358 RepID=UPI0037CB3743